MSDKILQHPELAGGFTVGGAPLATSGGAMLDKATPTTDSTAAAITYTAAMLLTKLLLRDPNGAGRSDVTPTAALLLAALPGAKVGSGFEFTIRNTADANETITVTAGSGCTLSGTMTIGQNNSRRFRVVFTNVTNSPAYTLYSLGISAH